MAKYYPQPPIDWATSLEKIYARQSKQLEEHHANLRQRDKQKVDKVNKDNFVDNLAKVAQFSTAAGSLVQSVKKSRAANEEKDKSAFVVKWAANGFQDEDYEIYNTTFKNEKDAVIAGDKKTIDVVSALKTQKKDVLAKAFHNLTGREKVWAQELIAQKTIASSISQEAYVTSLTGTPGALDAYNKKSNNDKDASFRSWALGQLSHLDLPDTFLAANVLGEIQRKTSTSSNLRAAIQSSEIADNSELSFAEQVVSKGTDSDPHSLGSYLDAQLQEQTSYFKDNPVEGQTPTQSATEVIANRLEKLLLSSDPQGMTLDNLNSYFGFNIDHPAGKTVGKVYFSKEQVNELVAAGKLGAGYRAARNLQEVSVAAENLRTKALTQGSFESTEDYHAAIDSLVGRGLSLENAGKLKSIKLWAQTADHYTSTLKEYTPVKIANASLEEINKIPNEKAREVIRKRKLQLLESEKMYGISKGSMDSIIMNSPERAVPWKVGMEVKGTGISGEIAMEIDNQGEALRAQLVWAQYDADGKLVNPNTEINTIVSDYKTNLWKSKGGGTTDGDGLYSIDSTTNTFSNYIDQSRDTLTLGQGSDYTTNNFKTWEHNRNTKYQGWNLNSKVPLLTKEDIQHTFLTGDMSDRMEYMMLEFPDLDITKILQHSIDIYTKNDKHSHWTGSLGLTNVAKFDGNQRKRKRAKETMVEGLDMVYNAFAVDDPNGKDASELKNLLNIKGWGYLNPFQKQRVLFYLSQNTDFADKLKEFGNSLNKPDATTDTN